MNNKIAWITITSFLDTDFYIVPLLMKEMDIKWYILKRIGEGTDYDRELSQLMEDNKNITVVSVSKKSYSLRRIKDYIRLLKNVEQNNEYYYVEMFGMPYFVPLVHTILGKRRVIMAIHNVHVPKGGKNYYIAKIYRDMTLKLFFNFQTFSKSQKDLLKQMKPKAHVNYIPFALKDYGSPSRARIDKRITFLSFGNIRPYKRIDVLIQAAQTAYEKTDVPFRVIIAGKCDDWEKYDLLIKYPQLFDLRIERVENHEIPNLFEESDYFVAPYQDIAQSGSSVVAVNYGLPIIASKLEAFEEYVINGYNGFLINPSDTHDLKEKIIYILKNHENIYPLLKKNMEAVKRENFSVDCIKEKYSSMFKDLLEENEHLDKYK